MTEDLIICRKTIPGRAPEYAKIPESLPENYISLGIILKAFSQLGEV